MRLIDTAGMRKKAKVDDKLEKLSVADARRAIDFAEVVVLLLDGTRGLEVQDLKIADQVLQEGRALIIAINKWDVAEGCRAPCSTASRRRSTRAWPRRAACRCSPSRARPARASTHCSPPRSRSARPGRSGCRPASSTAGSRRRSRSNPPPAPGGKRIKLRYITQVNTRPPSFVLFGTRVDQLPESYLRYLVNGIRKELGFGAVPVRLPGPRLAQSVRKCAIGAHPARSTVTFGAGRQSTCLPAATVLNKRRDADRGGRGRGRTRRLGEILARMRTELGGELRSHPRLFPRGRRESGGQDRGGDAPPRRRRLRPARAHAEGRSAPVRRRACSPTWPRKSSMPAAARSNRASFPTISCRRSRSCGRSTCGRWPLAARDQSARATAPTARTRGEQPGFRPALDRMDPSAGRSPEVLESSSPSRRPAA